MTVTIADVAKHAGVSMKTVSRVINSEPFVAEATRAKVMTAMKELGYVPNISASDQLEVLEQCRKHEYGMLISPCDSERPEDQQEILSLVA